MGGRCAKVLNYGYEPVPNFLFLIKKPFSVIPLRGISGSRVFPSFSLNDEMSRRLLPVSGPGEAGLGRIRIQEAVGRAGRGLWVLSPSPPSPPPHTSIRRFQCFSPCRGASLPITSLATHNHSVRSGRR